MTTATKTAGKTVSNKAKRLPVVTKNILQFFYAATAIEIVEGSEWYPTAYKYCEAIANETGLSVNKVAAVCAALSPNNRWERNIVDTENICLAYVTGGIDACNSVKVATYSRNKMKAITIITADESEYLTILNGKKIKAFYLSIIGEPDAVCVDGRAYAIFVGKMIPTTQTPSIGVALQNQIVSSYIRAKDKINKAEGTSYTAAQIQAITWVCQRRIAFTK